MERHCNCFLYQHCTPQWQLLLEHSAKSYTVKKGATIFKAGEPSTGYYFIHEGWVKVHKKWKDNRNLILKFAGGGEVLGHRGMSDNVHPVSASALTSVNICYISSEVFKASMMVNPDLAYEMTLLFAHELHEVEEKMKNLIQWDVKRRLAHALYTLAERFGVDAQGSLKVQLTRQDIASYTGTTYESVFKILNQWKEADVLQVKHKRIHIQNLNKLQEILHPAAP